MPTVTISIASPAVVTWASHGLNFNQPISFTTTGALPTGVTNNTDYYVKGNSATVTTPIASPGIVNWTGHGLNEGSPFKISGGTLPTPLIANIPYYVKYIDANTFNLATSVGGASLNFTGTSSGTQTGVGLPLGEFKISATPNGTNINTSGSQSGTHTGLSFIGEFLESVWATSTSYVVGQMVTYSGNTYTCLSAHTSSGTFSADAANWRLTSEIVMGDLVLTVKTVALAVPVTITNVIPGSRVRVSLASDGSTVSLGEATSNTYSFITKTSGAVIINVRKSSTLPKYLPYQAFGNIDSVTGMNVVVSQVLDSYVK